jgi:class 3 adenylate cyclase/tetratricopeptide (TPR) repeat protein
MICGGCGDEAADGARFCSRCGARLAGGPAPREVRKTVTVLFADLAGSTSLGESLDPESLRWILSRYFETVSRVLGRHGGTIEKFIGDAVVAVFGVPVASEDDALRAVRAAAEMREALVELNEELEGERGVRLAVRTGVNTGEVVAGEASAGQAIVTGDAVNVAARLEQAAAPGEILIGPGTERLVRSATRLEALLPLALKGKGEPVLAWRLLEVFPDAPALARRLDSPMVGREIELLQLEQAFRRAVRERSCCLFTLLGPAGVGKSRLAKEFTEAVADDATVLRGRCLPYGEGITFWPLAEIVRQITGGDSHGRIARLLAGEDDADRVDELISQAIGATESGASAGAGTFWAVRTLLEALARAQPVVVVFEDVHWAEPTFLELVDDLAESIRDAPVLIIALARPDLLEVRPGWGGGKLNAVTSLLAPLTAAESAELIESLVGDVELHSAEVAEARVRIVEAAEGNPLFIEQMLAMVDEGYFNGNGISVPPTIQALLAARLDALAPEERELLSRAAPMGNEFWPAALHELLPEDARDELDRKLDRLARRQLLVPTRSAPPGGPQYRFRHLLLRDAAYRALPKVLRAELHERFAAWLERAAREHVGEYGVIIGYHLERAFHEHVGVGGADARARRLAEAAATRLAAGGRAALARDDVRTAASLLDRAAKLLPLEETTCLELTLDLADCLFALGETARSRELLTRTLEQARTAGNGRVETYAFLQRRLGELRVDPSHRRDALRDAAAAAELLEPLGDDRGLARAFELEARAHVVAQHLVRAERALERAVLHARRAGDAAREQRLLANLCGLSLSTPTPVGDALARCRDLAYLLRSNRRAAAAVMLTTAGLHALRGEFEEARELADASRAAVEDLGLPRLLAGMAHVPGTIELLAGDGAAAEAELRRGYEFFRQTGEPGNLARSAALLGRALLLQGRLREASALAHEVEAAAAAEDARAQVAWRAIRARVLAERGDHDEAERLAREAAALAAGTDNVGAQGEALLDLAVVVATAGRAAEACLFVDRAVEVLERKGIVPAVAAAKTLRRELAA